MVSGVRGQAMIWVLLAIFIVAVIVLFLVVDTEVSVPNIIPGRTPPFSVESYLSKCIASEVERATEIMLPQGGFIEPTNFRLYNRTSVSYICLNRGYFEPCINQHPVLINEMEEEIRDFIAPGAGACVADLAQEIESRGGEFVGSATISGLNVELDFETATVSFDFPVTIIERESFREFEDFKVDARSAAYNLGVVAQEIANQESQFCYFETVGYSLANPRYKVVRKMLSDQSKIYVIEDKFLGRKMMVAVRSCALPEGMPG